MTLRTPTISQACYFVIVMFVPKWNRHAFVGQHDQGANKGKLFYTPAQAGNMRTGIPYGARYDHAAQAKKIVQQAKEQAAQLHAESGDPLPTFDIMMVKPSIELVMVEEGV